MNTIVSNNARLFLGVIDSADLCIGPQMFNVCGECRGKLPCTCYVPCSESDLKIFLQEKILLLPVCKTSNTKDEKALKSAVKKCNRPCSYPSQEACLKCNTPHRGQKQDGLLTPTEREQLARNAINLEYFKKHGQKQKTFDKK